MIGNGTHDCLEVFQRLTGLVRIIEVPAHADVRRDVVFVGSDGFLEVSTGKLPVVLVRSTEVHEAQLSQDVWLRQPVGAATAHRRHFLCAVFVQ